MNALSAEAKAAAGEIVKAAAGTGEQFDFVGWPAGFHAGASVLTAGTGVGDPEQLRVFWERAAEDALAGDGAVGKRRPGRRAERLWQGDPGAGQEDRR